MEDLESVYIATITTEGIAARFACSAPRVHASRRGLDLTAAHELQIDVSIIGAGPAGASLAVFLGHLGAQVDEMLSAFRN